MELAETRVVYLLTHNLSQLWLQPQLWDLNCFTAPAIKISRLKNARTRLQPVYFPVLWHLLSMLCLFVTTASHGSVSNSALLLVVFKWHRGSEGVNNCAPTCTWHKNKNVALQWCYKSVSDPSNPVKLTFSFVSLPECSTCWRGSS